MATIWVSSSERGAVNGTSYADAYGTLADGLGDIANKGDIVNIVNDGNHIWPTLGDIPIDLAHGQEGTSFDDPAYIIQGTDASGNAAMARIVSQAGGGFSFYLRGYSQYTIIQNLIWDSTEHYTDASAYTAIEWRDTTQGPHKIRYCAFLAAPTGQISSYTRQFLGYNTVQNDGYQCDVEYCYSQNVNIAMNPGGSQRYFKYCVFINDSTSARDGPAVTWGALVADQPDRIQRFLNCTIYDNNGSDVGRSTVDYGPGANVHAGEVSVYNNIMWNESTATNGAAKFMRGDAGATNVTHPGTINSNVLLGGPNITAGDLTVSGWYQLPWDANDDDATEPDIWPADTVGYGIADTDVFYDPASTYDWKLPNGLIITILKDLRLTQYTTSGRYGTAPGALGIYSEEEPDDPDDPDSPSAIPYLDVFPFYSPILLLELNMRMNTKRNREQEFYIRGDTENKGWREYTTRREILAANEETRIYSGIETGNFLIMEADNTVAMNAGIVEDVYLPDAKVVAVKGGDYEILKLKNNSGTASAKTLTVMVD